MRTKKAPRPAGRPEAGARVVGFPFVPFGHDPALDQALWRAGERISKSQGMEVFRRALEPCFRLTGGICPARSRFTASRPWWTIQLVRRNDSAPTRTAFCRGFMLASVRFIRTHAAAPSTIGQTKRAWAPRPATELRAACDARMTKMAARIRNYSARPGR